MSNGHHLESITREIVVKRRDYPLEDGISLTLNNVGEGAFVTIKDDSDDSAAIECEYWPLVRAAIDELMLIAKKQNGMEDNTDGQC